jgi:hypothetical protein
MQLNNDCGLSPLNGLKCLVDCGSLTFHVTVPVASLLSTAGEEPRSQSVPGDQCGVVGSTPSHTSIDTCVFSGRNPVADTVNARGWPAPSPGTWNGFWLGVVIDVAAKATPAAVINKTAQTMNRRVRRRALVRMDHLPGRNRTARLRHDLRGNFKARRGSLGFVCRPFMNGPCARNRVNNIRLSSAAGRTDPRVRAGGQG